jgi:membrane protein
MPFQPRRAPVFGALIAAASALYGATQAARPQPREKPAPERPSWGRILANVWTELDRDHISIMAAAMAFYGLLSIFPGMSALISLYGLAADPAVIEKQLGALSGVLPSEALKLLSDQLHALIAKPPARLGIGLIVSLALALWSATSAASMLMQALTVAYEQTDDRGILGFYLRAIALTIGIAVFGIVSLFLIAVVPAVLDRLPVTDIWRERLSLIRWPLVAGLVLLGLALVYRFAPARHSPCWHWLSPGTVAAALLWLIGSAGFSFYVANFGSYDKTYGSLGAVVILLIWFYVSAYIVLAGAELNSEYEKVRR